jgi:hypothetical protein
MPPYIPPHLRRAQHTENDRLSPPSSQGRPSVDVQTTDEKHRYNTYARTCFLLQPKPIKAEQCKEKREYAQWAGGYVEVTDKLFSLICPCNLVGKPCAFDKSKQIACRSSKDKAF